MTVDLGRVGIWSRELRFNPDRGARSAAAAELEELGYSAIFIPDVGGDVLGAVAELLAATRRVPLATGILKSIARSRPPAIRNGGRSCGPAWICAPIAVSGLMTRAIGRRESDSSPKSSLGNCWPARIPLSIRMVEPELPQFRGAEGALRRPAVPVISIVFSGSDWRSQETPSPRKQVSVLAQSAPVEKFSSRDLPSASAPSIA